jgi:hypothetical protein
MLPDPGPDPHGAPKGRPHKARGASPGDPVRNPPAASGAPKGRHRQSGVAPSMRSCGLSSPRRTFFPWDESPPSFSMISSLERHWLGVRQAGLRNPHTSTSHRLFRPEQRRDQGGFGGKKTFPPKRSGDGIRRTSRRGRGPLHGSPRRVSFDATGARPPLPESRSSPLHPLSPRASWFILLWRVRRDPRSRGPMMVWERGGLFFGSRVRRRPEWGDRSSPRGSTRPPGTCLHPVRLSGPPPSPPGAPPPDRTPPPP